MKLLETQNNTFRVNYVYIFAIHLITVSVKPCSQIWWHSTTLSWWEQFAVTAPSTSALNRSRQGDKLLKKLPQTLKLLLINMTNTATKPLALPDASLLQFPSSCLVTSPHDCSHCPLHRARLSPPGLSKTSWLQIPKNLYSNGRSFKKSLQVLLSSYRSKTSEFVKIFWRSQNERYLCESV